ncbi:MAG: hypothetical protein HOP29_05985 [Phycisphaerales bacterium]|nr:hypothetical protein [Phycisphaerales bacterium]
MRWRDWLLAPAYAAYVLAPAAHGLGDGACASCAMHERGGPSVAASCDGDCGQRDHHHHSHHDEAHCTICLTTGPVDPNWRASTCADVHPPVLCRPITDDVRMPHGMTLQSDPIRGPPTARPHITAS